MDLFFFSLSSPWLLVLAPLLWGILLWLDRRRRRPRRLLLACEALLPRLVPKRQQRAQTRWTLDLILLLSIALLASIILAGPKTQALHRSQNIRVIVFERGLSTMAGGRLATLKELLINDSKSWPEETIVRLHLNPPGGEKSLEGTVSELSDLVASVKSLPYDAPIKDHLNLALSSPGEVVLVTDKNPRLDPWLRERVRVLAKARRLGNVSLLRAGARRLNDSEDQVQVAIQNASAKPRSMTVTLETLNSKTKKKTRITHKLALKPGEVRTLLKKVSRHCEEARWTLSELSHRPEEDRLDWDALEIDNEQILIRPAVEERRIRVSGEIPYEVLRALSVIEGTRVEEGPPMDGVFSIVSGSVPDPLTTPSLLILPPKDGERFLDKPGGLSWIARDGFLLHPFETPTLAKARLSPPSGLGELRPLLVTKDGELLLGVRGQGSSFVAYCGFSMESAETDWSQLASFPLFFHALVTNGVRNSPTLTSVPAGTVIRDLEAWAGSGNFEFGLLNGVLTKLESGSQPRLERPGIYRARARDGREKRWAVSVQPELEGLLVDFVAEGLDAGKKVRADKEREESAEKGPAFFALLCIVVLIARRMNVVKSGAEGA